MDTDYTAKITARGADCCPTDPDAVDADIYADGEYVGAVTLRPPEDERARYTHDGKLRLEQWGDCVDCWADNDLMVHMMLNKTPRDRDWDARSEHDQREIIGAIEYAVTLAAHTEA